jgi:hypothetical protein
MREIYANNQQVIAWMGLEKTGHAGTHLVEGSLKQLLEAQRKMQSPD